MTLQDCLDYRRRAQSIFEENEQEKTKGLIRHSTYVDRYHYLKGWMQEFDRCLDNFTCWHEQHVVYIDGLARLKKLSISL